MLTMGIRRFHRKHSTVWGGKHRQLCMKSGSSIHIHTCIFLCRSTFLGESFTNSTMHPFYVCRWMNCDECIHLCTSIYEDTEYVHPPRKTPTFCSPPPPHPGLRQPQYAFFHSKVVLPVLELHMVESCECVLLLLVSFAQGDAFEIDPCVVCISPSFILIDG